jgi:1,2-dihydroxy-3-keto-5-methylthiopentene dioxygenase
MTKLIVYLTHNPSYPILETTDVALIADTLAVQGVTFERWPIPTSITPRMTDTDILSVFEPQTARILKDNGFKTLDVIHLTPDHPQKQALRVKFLQEHTHAEDEVRFFVAGESLFYLRISDKIYGLYAMAGDYIHIPAQTKHWFDMGEHPHFTALRFFNNPEGWVAHYTGDAIAERFPTL